MPHFGSYYERELRKLIKGGASRGASSSAANGYIFAEDYGVLGDGGDHTSEMILALRALGSGKLYLPAGRILISSVLQVYSEGVHIIGAGRDATILVGTSDDFWMFDVQADYFHLQDLQMTNGDPVDLVEAYPDHDGGLVQCRGISTDRRMGVHATNCKFSGINGEGFVIEQAEELIIQDCVFEDINNSAVGIRDTCDRIRVLNSEFKNIVCSGPVGTNRYFIHSGYDDNIVSDPTNLYYSRDYIVDGCLFDGNSTWEAIDAHGGEYIQFTNNTVRNCYQGVLLACAARSTPPVANPKLQNVICSGNTIDLSDMDEKEYGIIVRGYIYPDAANSVYPYNSGNILVSDNVLIGCGSPVENHIGAIVLEVVSGAVVQNNYIRDFHGSAVLFYQYCDGCVVQGNTLHNAALPTESTSVAIVVAESYNGAVVPNVVHSNTIIDDNGNLDYALGERGTLGRTGTNMRAFDNTFLPYAGSPFIEYLGKASEWRVENWDGHTELSDIAWDDLTVTAGNVKKPASSNPTDNTTWITNVWSLEFAQGNYVYFEGMQLPHRRQSESDIHAHVHFSPLADIADGETITWDIDYSVAAPFDGYPSSSSVQTAFTNDAASRAKLDPSVLSGTTILASAKPHLITTSAVISGAGLTLSAVMCGKLEYSSSSTYTGNVIFLSADAHIKIDRLGSENEFTD